MTVDLDNTKILAESLNKTANEEAKIGNFRAAVDLYSEAIKLDNTNPKFYCNRSNAYKELEEYGYAVSDASKALEIDKSFYKGYYRRGIALFCQGNMMRPAIRDLKVATQAFPLDRDAANILAKAQKLLKREELMKAIAVEKPGSALDDINIDTVHIPADYDGAALGAQMTLDFIEDMKSRFKNEKLIALKYVYAILKNVKDIFKNEPTINEIKLKEGQEVIVVGDTHGQYFDLLTIFERQGQPSKNLLYIFNGDFVDRGSWSCEVALLLYAYKWLYPDTFFINRGNHETDDMNKVYGFEGECKAKYNDRVFRAFSESFSALSLATLISDSYLVLHGGLFSDDDVDLDTIRKFDRFSRSQPGQEGIMMEMLWTDPQTMNGRGASKRGVGMQFGPDITEQFCKKNNLKAIIRSHEVREEGYEVEHNGRCITVFSAPNYCDQTGNKGATIRIGTDLELKYDIFDAVPHPNIKPMAYANNMMFGF